MTKSSNSGVLIIPAEFDCLKILTFWFIKWNHIFHSLMTSLLEYRILPILVGIWTWAGWSRTFRSSIVIHLRGNILPISLPLRFIDIILRILVSMRLVLLLPTLREILIFLDHHSSSKLSTTSVIWYIILLRLPLVIDKPLVMIVIILPLRFWISLLLLGIWMISLVYNLTSHKILQEFLPTLLTLILFTM